MKIAIDVDEVLANLVDAVITFHNEAYGTVLTRDTFQSYNYEQNWGGTREEAIKKMLRFFDTPHFANIQPLEGAVSAVHHLAKKHELAVITARQSVIAEQTNTWLEKHFPGCFREIHVTNLWGLSGQTRRKKDVCQEIRADLFIDDSLGYACECAELGIPVLMFDYPWNQTAQALPANVKRVTSWPEIVSEVDRENFA